MSYKNDWIAIGKEMAKKTKTKEKSVEELCLHFRISRRTLYRYFDNVEAAGFEILSRQAGKFVYYKIGAVQ